MLLVLGIKVYYSELQCYMEQTNKWIQPVTYQFGLAASSALSRSCLSCKECRLSLESNMLT